MKYLLSYSCLMLRGNGHFDETYTTVFGTAYVGGEAKIYESGRQAMDNFMQYLDEHSDEGTVKDVTDSDGLQGYGPVIYASDEEYGDTLYRVWVSELMET